MSHHLDNLTSMVEVDGPRMIAQQTADLEAQRAEVVRWRAVLDGCDGWSNDEVHDRQVARLAVAYALNKLDAIQMGVYDTQHAIEDAHQQLTKADLT